MNGMRGKEVLELRVKCAEVYHPKPKAGVTRSDCKINVFFSTKTLRSEHKLRVDHHQRLALSAPENAWVVEARDIDKGSEFPLATLCRCGRDAQSHRARDASHTTCRANMVNIVRGTRLFARSCIFRSTNIADICLAQHIFLIVPVRSDSAHQQILIFRPIWKGYDSWIPENPIVGALRIGGNIGYVLDDIWQPDMVSIRVRRYGALEESVQTRVSG